MKRVALYARYSSRIVHQLLDAGADQGRTGYRPLGIVADVIGQCGCGTIAECRIIEMLAPQRGAEVQS
jgi:hypothetical protein